jgi:hypothetical protein
MLTVTTVTWRHPLLRSRKVTLKRACMRPVCVLGQVRCERAGRCVDHPGRCPAGPRLRWPSAQPSLGADVTEQGAAAGMDGEVGQGQVQAPVDAPGGHVVVGVVDRLDHVPGGQVSPGGLAQGAGALADHAGGRDPGFFQVSEGIAKGLDVACMEPCRRPGDLMQYRPRSRVSTPDRAIITEASRWRSRTSRCTFFCRSRRRSIASCATSSLVALMPGHDPQGDGAQCLTAHLPSR